MLWLSLLVCLSTILQASTLGPVHASKPKPLDLAFSCKKDSSNRNQHDNVPIFLIHGMGCFKKMWKDIIDVLAVETGKEVCTVDLRNHGESPWSDEVDTVAMTEDILHLIDKLEIRKAIFLGHSLGGKLVVHLALTYPERVEKIIVEDMRPNGLSPEGLTEIKRLVNVFKNVGKLIPKGVSEKEAKEFFIKNYKEYLVKDDASMRTDDPDLYPIKCTEGICRWNANTLMFDMMIENIYSVIPDSFGQFDGPALFMYGTDSNMKVGDDESSINKLFPNARLVGVKGAGHFVHVFPEFMTTVIKFINERIREEF